MRLLFTPPEPTRSRAPRRAHPPRRPRLVRRAHARPHRRPPLPVGSRVGHAALGRPRAARRSRRTSRVCARADSLKSYLATLDLVGQLDGVTARPARARPSVRRRARPRRGDQGAPRRAHGAAARRRRSRSGPATVADALARAVPEAALGHDGRERDVRPPRALVHAGDAERWEEDGMLDLPRSEPRRSRDAARDRRAHDGDDAMIAEAKSVDLLSHLIRNECVNDGTPESGHEIAQRRPARAVPRRRRSRPRALRAAARAARAWSPASRAAIRPRRRCC